MIFGVATDLQNSTLTDPSIIITYFVNELLYI